MSEFIRGDDCINTNQYIREYELVIIMMKLYHMNFRETNPKLLSKQSPPFLSNLEM